MCRGVAFLQWSEQSEGQACESSTSLISECEMQQIIKEKKNVFNPSCNDEVLVIELMVEFRYEIGKSCEENFWGWKI